MLVLSRKIGEKIIIDGRITLQVVAISGNKVRLGIVAPPDVEILREELCVPDRIVSAPERTSFREMAYQSN
jgi:carbon storage regulator CsrA